MKPMIAPGASTAVGLLLVLWLVHPRSRNAAVVDVGWTIAIGLQAVAAALLGPGDLTRRGIVGVVGGLWSLRLATHLARRVATEPEDPRYAELRARWGGNVRMKFLAFFLFQGVLATLLAAPELLLRLAHLVRVRAARTPVAVRVGDRRESIADALLPAACHRDPSDGGTCAAVAW